MVSEVNASSTMADRVLLKKCQKIQCNNCYCDEKVEHVRHTVIISVVKLAQHRLSDECYGKGICGHCGVWQV